MTAQCLTWLDKIANILKRQLLAFRSGARRHPTMNFFSGQITMDEIAEIAGCYALLPKP